MQNALKSSLGEATGALILARIANRARADKIGNATLLYACKCGHRELSWFLLSNEAQINITNETSGVALRKAVKNDWDKVLKQLLEKGVPVDAKHPYKKDALLHAFQYGHKRLVDIFLQYKGPVDAKTLFYATQFEWWDVVHILLDRDITLCGNNSNFQEIAYSTWVASLDIDLDYRNWSDQLLRLAFERGDNNSVNILLEYVVESSPIRENEDVRSLGAAISRRNAKALAALLDHGVGVEDNDADGRITLFYAIKYGQYDCVKLLVDKHANLTIIDRVGQHLIHAAAFTKNKDCIEWALAEVVDGIEARDANGLTPLQRAVLQNNSVAVQLFINGGADIEVRDEHGRTPVFTAVLHSSDKVFWCLIHNGVDLKVLDNRGLSPIQIAKAGCYRLIVRVMFANGKGSRLLNHGGPRAKKRSD